MRCFFVRSLAPLESFYALVSLVVGIVIARLVISSGEAIPVPGAGPANAVPVIMSNQTICDQATPDPWMISHNGKFYLTFTLGNRVEIWASNQMEDFRQAEKSVIWHPAPGSDWSADIWAPELHHLNGQWYVYVAGAPPGIGNPGHRTLVLRSANLDPLEPASWQFLGPLQGLPHDQWSIDATVFTLDGSDLYLCYSGWPLGDHSDTQQDLFLVRMKNPEEADPESLVCISRAELPWERPEGGRRGVNEGPTFITLPPSRDHPQGFQGIVYSAHGSWTKEYKLAILALVDPSKPCVQQSWAKRPVPLLVSDDSKGGPFGPGHASFILSPYNDGATFCIYHGTERPDEGWANRKARILRLGAEAFRADALPVCCASGMLGGGPAYATGAPGAQGHSGDGLQKILGAVDKRVPPQYRGTWDKVRKFF